MSEHLGQPSQDAQVSNEEQVRERAPHWWTRLACVRQGKVGKDVPREKGMRCTWTIRWTELERRETKQGTRVPVGAERRGGSGNDIGHYREGS